ncbi:MAG TPA: excinuclease ABC subunit UvrC [Firmicutes bacterium]|nr:excinuclease ABC subunit UvrC [Bacillota bacterium]
MKGENGEVIYVGKAVSLRSRVRSYFGAPEGLSLKTRALVASIRDIEYIVTGSEVDALILENTLIKRYRPWFNIRLRDDKTYPYVKVTMAEPFPRVVITRRVVDDGARYFGPYADTGALRDTLAFIKRLFPVRSCKRDIPADVEGRGDAGPSDARSRPCLNYHIGRCLAPCSGRITREAYRQVIDQICLFLEGRQDELLRSMRKEMQAAATLMDFERAAVLRDRIRDIERVIEKQKVVSVSPVDEDVIALAREGDNAVAQVFQVRGGKLIGNAHFVMENTNGDSNEEVMESFIKDYYSRRPSIGDRILLQYDVQDHEAISLWLSSIRGKKVKLVVPKRGEKKALVDMAAENAALALRDALLRDTSRRSMEEEAVQVLREVLGLPSTPIRIEAYDISNIHGRQAVGSMVVFENGRPAKSEYRRFRIKTVAGPDDFAMMREVLTRRLKRAVNRPNAPRQDAADGPEVTSYTPVAPDDVQEVSPHTSAAAAQGPGAGFSRLPDLILVDGGKGQLSHAMEALNSLGFRHIPVIGLAKEFEEIYLPHRPDPIRLPRDSKALFLLQRVRDEAHRFAVSYHRKLRQKEEMESRLAGIPGIGEKRLKNLLMKFGSIDGIRAAAPEELAAVPGMNRKVAEALVSYLASSPSAP